jgi:hypothetical protein
VKTEDLILQLATSAAPVTPLAAPSIRLVRWMAVSALVTAVAIVAIGARHDLIAAAARPAFTASLVALLLATVSAAAAALMLSVPGAERSPLQRALPMVAAAAWPAAWLAAMTTHAAPGGVRLFHSACAIEIAALGAASGWVLFVMIRRAAPIRPGWTAGVASLAAITSASAATQVICPIDDPAHQLLGHVLVAAVLGLAGFLTGQRLLRRSSERLDRGR